MGSNNNQAMTVFVLGLLSVISCQILGPVALIMGNNYMAQCEMDGVEPDGLGKAGRILGIVGTVFLGLGIVFGLLYFVMIFLLVASGSM